MQSKKKMPTADTLFRFLQIRNPGDEMPDQVTEKRFIENGLSIGSVFLNAVDGLENQEDIDAALQVALESFTPLKSAKEVKALNPAMLKFGQWVSDPKSDLVGDYATRSAGLSPISDADLITLWDNLYYLVITTGSTGTRDAIIKQIRGTNFLEEADALMKVDPDGVDPKEDPTPELLLLLENLSAASVMIPSVLTSKKHAVETLEPGIDAYQRKALGMLQSADISRFNVARYGKAIDEIKSAKTIYTREAGNEFTQALAAHNVLQEAAWADAGVDKQTREPKLPDLPVFNFEPTVIFNDEYIEGKVSEESYLIYQDFKEREHKTPDEVSVAIEAEMAQEYKNISDNAILDITIQAFNGLVLPVNNKPANNSIMVNSVRLYRKQPLYTVFYTQYFETPDSKVRELDMTVTSGATTIADTAVKKAAYETDTHITFQLFKEGSTVDLQSTNANYSVTYRTVKRELSGIKTSTATRLPEVYLPRVPDTDFDGEPGTLKNSLYGVKRLTVGEYNRVEQEIACYVPGEVSHIENIMAREYKEKTARNLNRTETTTEDTRERESEDLKDTTSTDRHEMQAEVSRVLQEDRAFQLGASVGVSGPAGPMEITTNVNANYSGGSSETNSFNQSESYAQEVTERAMQRIVEKVTYKRTSRMLQEFEETSKHGFDNREGDKHVTGIYRWVDKVYKNTLINYGRRLMYEFMVPEPAKNFKYWMTKKAQQDKAPNFLTLPKTLLQNDIKGPFDVNRSNYGAVAAEYGADVEACPAAKLRIGKSFSEIVLNTGTEHKKKKDVYSGAFEYEFEIPEGYECNEYSYGYVQDYSAHQKDGMNSFIKIGIHQHYWEARKIGGTHPTAVPIGDKLPVSLVTFGVGVYALNIVAYCDLTDAAYQKWQNETYIALLEAYNEKRQRYEDAYLASFAPTVVEEKKDYNFNPLIGRSIEQRELKRICIDMITRPFGFKMGQNLHSFDACADNYKISLTPTLDNYAEHVRFLEEAFDWEILSYMLYPYYWGMEMEWGNLIKEKSSADFIFQAFLQSGMGKVTLPVKPGYERSVLYYLDSGKIWESKDVVVQSGNGIYAKILSELMLPVYNDKNKPPFWFTKVPTALTIIQSNSAPLDADGLPCKCYAENGVEVVCNDAIATGNNLLQGASGSDTGTTTKVGLVEFLADTTLTSSDIGKIVVNIDGKAKVASTVPGAAGQFGKWQFSCLPITPPIQAKYELELTAQPNAGDTFKIGDISFKFVSGPVGAAGQIEIGSSLSQTLDNCEASISYMPNYFENVAQLAAPKIGFSAGNMLPGEIGNVYFYPETAPVSFNITSAGQHNDFYQLDSFVIHFEASERGGHVNIDGDLKLSDILALGAPNGTQIGQYKWPTNGDQLGENIVWALNSNNDFSSRFNCSKLSSNLFEIAENTFGYGADITQHATPPYVFNSLTQTQLWEEYIPDIVNEVVLGRLEQLNTSTGKAYINPNRIFKVKLSAGTTITFDTSIHSDPLSRLLMFGNNGEAVNFTQMQPSHGPGNGFLMALQEGTPGDEIWVDRVYILGG
jgi:hypothetical protein